MMKTINFSCLLLTAISLLAALLPSCEGIIPDTPPYIITTPVCRLSYGSSYDFTYAGISFSFMNKSEKTVDSVTACFTLFDSKTQSNPFTGGNVFEITKLVIVPPGENSEIVLSLDSFIHIAPSEPYLIDFFYISEIHYTDDSTWKDGNGTYSVRVLE
jgi:hypothetical protein